MKKWIGIDVSKAVFDVAVDGESTCVRYAYTKAGMTRFVRSLKRIEVEGVVMEATGGYERELCKRLQKAGWPVAVVNPRRIRDYARAVGVMAKTDRLDAGIIARYAAAMRPAPNETLGETALLLKALSSRRRQLVAMRTMEKNRTEHVGDRTIGQSLHRILEVIEREIERLDRAIAAAIASDRERSDRAARLQTMPGVGACTANLLVTDLPELGIYNRRQIAALIGVAPMNRDSGTFRGKRMTGGGRHRLRTALYMPTLVAIQHNPVIRGHYQRLVGRGKPKMTAVVACMRKLVLILNTMMRKNEAWNPNFA